MSQDTVAEDLMGYENMVQMAMRGVVRAALERAAGPEGIPGEHHFYISFKTQAPGVSGPDDLLSRYPEEMTIVLQHQYWDLETEGPSFSVTLRFGGQPKRVTVPYAALTRFFDPSIQFMLQFEPLAETAVTEPDLPPEPEPSPTDPNAPNVVSLDRFRKK